MSNYCVAGNDGKQFGPFQMPFPDEEVFAIRRRMKTNKRGVVYTTTNPKDVEIVRARVAELTFEEPFSMEDGYAWHGTAYVMDDTKVFPDSVAISKANTARTEEEAQCLLKEFQENGLFVRADGYVKSGRL